MIFWQAKRKEDDDNRHLVKYRRGGYNLSMLRILDEKFWNKYFEVYDVLNEAHPYQQLMDNFVRETGVKKGNLVLDAGSGTGNLAIRLKKEGAEVIGVDISEVGIKKHRRKDKNAQVLKHDLIFPLPFRDNHFDKIVCNNTIYTIAREKRGDIFKEFYRVLKPKGIIVISDIKVGFSPIKIYLAHLRKEFKQNSPLVALMKVIKLLPPTIQMFYYNYFFIKPSSKGVTKFIEPGEHKKLLTAAGFQVIESKLTFANQAIMVKAVKRSP